MYDQNHEHLITNQKNYKAKVSNKIQPTPNEINSKHSKASRIETLAEEDVELEEFSSRPMKEMGNMTISEIQKLGKSDRIVIKN